MHYLYSSFIVYSLTLIVVFQSYKYFKLVIKLIYILDMLLLDIVCRFKTTLIISVMGI